jgi:hypothetical protein
MRYYMKIFKLAKKLNSFDDTSQCITECAVKFEHK